MKIKLFQVDAFSSSPLSGNPAAVCPPVAGLPDAVMKAIAAENNLAETAYFAAVAITTRCAGSRPKSKSTCAGTPRLQPRGPARNSWARWLDRVSEVDPEHCPACHRHTKLAASSVLPLPL